MAEFTGKESLSFDDILIIPGRQISGKKPDDVDLGYKIKDGFYQPLGWYSAAMQCISGPELGIAMARHGGCAVLPRSLSIDDQVEMGKKIKREKAGFNYNVITVSPDMLIGELMKISSKTGYSLYPVIDKGKLLGIITEKKYHPRADRNLKVYERMISREELIVGSDGIALKDANDLLLRKGIGILPIVDKENNYVCSVFWEDIKKHVEFPKEFVDNNGRYRFAGAVSTFEEDMDRVRELVKEAECDLICIDTSDIKSDYGVEQIKRIKKEFDVPVMAGNIVDAEGFLLIAESGADIGKIGQGPGFGCTTRKVKGSGRGQITALLEIDAERREYEKRNGRKIGLCLDGGIRNPGDILKAYACDSDFVMMGSYLGGYTESAAPLRKIEAKVGVPNNPDLTTMEVEMKEYWGEGSERAMNTQRYGYPRPGGFVPEGVEKLIPHKGSIYDKKSGLQADIDFVKRVLCDSGAMNPREYSMRVKIERQSEATKEEGA